MNDWNREEVEDELREQLHTLLHVTSAMQPKSDEEFMAVALPNLVMWAHSFHQIVATRAAEAMRQRCVEAMPEAESDYRLNLYNPMSLEAKKGWNAYRAAALRALRALTPISTKEDPHHEE